MIMSAWTRLGLIGFVAGVLTVIVVMLIVA